MQHPLAELEIVPWDSTYALLFSREKTLVDQFRTGYPQSEDLASFILRPKKSERYL